MKRLNNLFQHIISGENLNIADKKAQKNKSNQYGVKIHNNNREENILKLHYSLISKTYRTSEYDIFKVFEPKERDVYRLPYFPDRICHHAIMNVLEPIFVAIFTDVLNIEIIVQGFKIEDSKKKQGTKYLTLQIEIDYTNRVVFTGSKNLMDLISQVPDDKFPFQTIIKKNDKRLEFT